MLYGLIKFKKKEIQAICIILITSIIGIAIRERVINFVSSDFTIYLERWYDFIFNNGKILALKYNFADYTMPYIYLLTLGTYIKISALKYIKLVSIIFDFVAAIIAIFIVKKKYPNKITAYFAYPLIILLPTVILNGALWAQCDIIFTAFMLIAIYFIMNEKYSLAVLFFAIAFTFKLQTIFISPLFLVLLLKKKIKLRNTFIVPAVYFIFMIPALIEGRGLLSLLTIYLDQSKEKSELTLNLPNIYFMVPDDSNVKLLTYVGILLAVLLVLAVVFIQVKYVKELTNEKIIELSLIFTIVIPFLLPRMHERYYFTADVISVLYAFYFPKRFFVPIIIQTASVLAYVMFLFNMEVIPLPFVALTVFADILFIFYMYIQSTTTKSPNI